MFSTCFSCFGSSFDCFTKSFQLAHASFSILSLDSASHESQALHRHLPWCNTARNRNAAVEVVLLLGSPGQNG